LPWAMRNGISRPILVVSSTRSLRNAVYLYGA
jgi:hypothetical protein